MNVLVIGSGGREHALAWAVSRSPAGANVYVAPGNPGTKHIAQNVALDAADFAAVADFCKGGGVDLVVVGPENPLADGIADYLRDKGIAVFGPGRAGAMLEASKTHAKQFMERHGVPHAGFASFTDLDLARDHVKSVAGPYVLKADGLALGKGVSILSDRQEALAVLDSLFSGKAHGNAGKRVVIEEFLEGRELTVMALTDGKTLFPLPFARDHKRVFDGDRGPMTGGMGAFSPVPLADKGMERQVIQDILHRTLDGLKQDGIDYRGVIYAGLMMTKDGPKVLEYNVRFGDPESQCVLPLLSGDLAGALLACAEGRLAEFLQASLLTVKDGACVTVVMASGGYPGPYRKGLPVSGTERSAAGPALEDTLVFHAGTKEEGGQVVTSGGRVLAVAALGPTIENAAERAYARVDTIRFEGAHYRRDIVGDAK